MTAPAAGWYADPTGGPGLRYWNGTGWTDSTQQAAQPAYGQTAAQHGQPPYGPGPGQYGQGPGQYGQGPGQYGQAPAPFGQPPSTYGQAPSSGSQAAGLWALNKTSLITVLICIVYLVIAGFSHLVFFGILPILYTVRSFQAKESLAWLAALVTVVTIGFSIWRTTH